MDHLVLNVLIFVAFYAIAFGHHYCCRDRSAGASHGLASMFAVAAHPAFIEAVRDFVVHIIVYSGYVMPQH